MNVPKIGNRLITDIYEQKQSLDLFQLYSRSDASDNDKSLVSLLDYAAGDTDSAKEILLRCFNERKHLLAYYPALDRKEPSGELVGTILDGSLWIVSD